MGNGAGKEKTAPHRRAHHKALWTAKDSVASGSDRNPIIIGGLSESGS